MVRYRRFEFLAFSSDVSHWRQKQELVGVSVRCVLDLFSVRLEADQTLYRTVRLIFSGRMHVTHQLFLDRNQRRRANNHLTLSD